MRMMTTTQMMMDDEDLEMVLMMMGITLWMKAGKKQWTSLESTSKQYDSFANLAEENILDLERFASSCKLVCRFTGVIAVPLMILGI